MMLSMMGLGFLSAFALGPASFSIIRSLLSRKTWPWGAILGFLTADLIYIALALVLLQSSLLNSVWLEKLLTVLTVGCLSIYSVKVLFSSAKSYEVPSHGYHHGFLKSLFLTLGNFHLVFIYAGLFLNLSRNSSLLSAGITIYIISFILGFLGLLMGLRQVGTYLKNILRKVEIFAACGFLSFSVYLFLGIL